MKKTFLFLFFALTVFSFGTLVTDTNTAFAVAPGAGDGGCCGGGSTGGGDGGGSTGGGGGGSTPNPPSCSISASISKVYAGGSYVISWTGTNNAVYRMNNALVNPSGSYTYTMDAGNEYERFVIYGKNGDGECADEVKVYQKFNAPVCDINTSLSVAKVGDAYTVTWAGTPAQASFKINGSNVPDSGSKGFTFTGPNEDKFTMTGELHGETCSDVATVVKHVQTPAPTCDAFTAAPPTITVGQSTTLNWASTNATAASINNNVGSVTVDGSKIVSPTVNTTYKLTLIAAGYDPVHCEAPVYVNPVNNELPLCTAFTATPGTLPVEGGSVVLDWDVLRVASIVIDNGVGTVLASNGSDRGSVSGSQSFPVTQSTTFTLTATDIDGDTDSCTAPVVVPTVVDPIEPQCLSFTTDKTTIVAGESINLNWSTANAIRVSIDNAIGDVTGTSFGPITLTTNALYKLTVFGADGTTPDRTCEVAITVTPVVNPTTPAISIIKRDATDKDDTQAVTVGGTANFEIVVKNTGNEDLVNVVVTDPIEPACNRTIGSLAIGATETYTCVSTNVQNAFTNVANVTGDSVVDGETVTDTDPTNITITTSTPVLSCSDISLSASDTSVREGSDVTLNWVSTGNVGSVSIDNGIGSVNLTDSRTVRVDQTTTYNFTINGFNDSQNCPITISTTTGGGGGGSSSPRCELEISDTKINRGDEITLTWDSTRARELILTDDRGNVIVTTEDKLSDDKEEFFEGEITLSPTRDTEYTLRVERGSRDRECTVDVEMEDDEVVLLQTRDQAPLVTGISLTEVPYTGFEAGSVMTFMFYTLLVAWALYITYVLVIPKTMLTAAPVLVTPRTTSDLMTSAENIRPDVFATLLTKSVVASSAQTAPAPANLPVAQTAPVAFVADAVEADTATTATEVENEAHLHQALLSSGAVQSLIAMTTDADRSQTLTKVITDAKGAYPLEDGWVVINQTRLTELTATPAPTPAVEATTAVTGNGSLAEAIVTGNVVAAYELIGDRPMFALADASADLDTLYRNRKGANEQVSDLLTAATKDITDAQIADMIAALTGAIDGTYTDEASAVKMAIMKAVKIAA